MLAELRLSQCSEAGIILQQNEPAFLGEMVGSRAGTGK